MGITTETSIDLAAAAADSAVDQDALYERVSVEFSAPLARLARAHEADPSLQQDLLQEIHIALWRSLSAFVGRCSQRTWVYRVAHNTAATWVLRRRCSPVPRSACGTSNARRAASSAKSTRWTRSHLIDL